MPETAEVKELVTKLNTLHEDFKKVNDAAEAERKKFGEELALSKESVEKLQKQLDDTEAKLKRHNFGNAGPGEKELSAEEKAYTEVYVEYLKKGDKQNSRMSADQVEALDAYYKSLSADDDTAGGYLMPVNKRDEMIMKLIEVSPVRQFATVITLDRGDNVEIPAEGTQNFDCDWVGERQGRPETTSGKIRKETIPVNELYAKPLITQKLLEDVPQAETWMAGRVATCFAQKEGAAFVNGDAVNKPEGFLQSDVPIVTSSTSAVIKADDIYDLFYDLRGPYANRAAFGMERKTIRDVRKLKDGDGQYLWQPGLQGDQPALLIGRPVIEMIDMPVVAASAKAVVVADWAMFYWIVQRRGVTLLRDPYSSKPFVEFYFTMRVGGQVTLAEAGRVLQIKA